MVWFWPLYSDMVRLILYTDIETAILNKGFFSKHFKPSRGVRQGCCILPYLFILLAEILAIQIRNDPDICGIMVEGKELKLSLFADYLTGFTREQVSLKKMINRPWLRHHSQTHTWKALRSVPHSKPLGCSSLIKTHTPSATNKISSLKFQVWTKWKHAVTPGLAVPFPWKGK